MVRCTKTTSFGSGYDRRHLSSSEKRWRRFKRLVESTDMTTRPALACAMAYLKWSGMSQSWHAQRALSQSQKLMANKELQSHNADGTLL